MIDIQGDVVAEADMQSARAREMLGYLHADHTPYIRLIECRRSEDREFIVIEIGVEVASKRSVDIRGTEPIAIWCNPVGKDLPQAIPIRDDFPIDHLHAQVDAECQFALLCLWEGTIDELSARYTPFMYFSRLKEWLELAADGKLHADDQPLEPVLMGCKVQAILPAADIDLNQRYVATVVEGLNNSVTVRFSEFPPDGKLEGDARRFVLLPLETNPVCGRAVRMVPRTLDEMDTILSEYGVDLGEEIKNWVIKVHKEEGLADACPVLFIRFPKQRTPDGTVETHEDWAFMISQDVGPLGDTLGLFYADHGRPVHKIGGNLNREALTEVDLDPMIVIRRIKPENLPVFSGSPPLQGDSLQIAAIGVGALGSKVVELCARSGFGQWALFDKDIFLPHNVVRHILGDHAIGLPKAPVVKNFINGLVPGNPVTQFHIADVADEDTLDDAAKSDLEAAALIADMSASVVVARSLALDTSLSRCISLFLDPSGQDLVVLAEDQARDISLIDLEASYYAAVVDMAELGGHLRNVAQGGVRFGNGCRDITSLIPPDQVSLLGGLAARALRKFAATEEPGAVIYRTAENGKVDIVEPPICHFSSTFIGDWTVRWSDDLIAELKAVRQQDLPNETGGVLLGLVDFSKKIILVSAAIKPPPDSIKKPHYFERGKTGLEKRLREIGDLTAGQLHYVGEWHSHPDHAAASPSPDDEALFAKLGEIFDGTSEPYIMAIIGEKELYWRIGVNAWSDQHTLLMNA